MFNEEVKAITQIKDGTIVGKFTEEQRKMLTTTPTAANTETVGRREGSEQVTIATQISNMISKSKENSSGVFADMIRVLFKSGPYTTDCAVAKATNICTALIEEASVLKINAVMNITHSEKGKAADIQLKNEHTDYFKKADVKAIDARIIKDVSISDLRLDATVFPGDIRRPEDLNSIIQAADALKNLMLSEYLRQIDTSDENLITTAYRNVTRGIADSIFDSVYAIAYGKPDAKDPVAVDRYIKLYKAFNEGKSSIGSMYLSSDSADFGIDVRKISISPDPVWTNINKMKRVKRFGFNSYYISTNEDSNIGRIPTTPEIVERHMREIEDITKAALAVVETEARLEVGYDMPLDYKIPTIKPYTGPKNYYELMNIQKTKQDEILNYLQEKYYDLAQQVLSSDKENRRLDASDRYAQMSEI